ncbi:MAG: T9SS type A sorting domain-containing protein [Flavobacteriales bacterium]|nr:T9SS type A sorting domain-containing protein [Flavobacteriales bacterium]MBT5698538.1 T9SS type A sorting domain-containing protein [Flavobacteriales bacterium]MBT6699420.1 T9SS type A sorting domain-containing protein [Flavobacteriales bacterium]MBT6814865.1 T9SS type A sorting domain-containing protein [Flavobacteriales bacterium]MBT7726567.1 T9SS type A sorting domain-containing protein [Flavobacteriales bacterium]
MKKLLLFTLATALSMSSYSTHLMGGQIVTSYLGTDSLGSHYAVELTAYRDTIGIPMVTSAVFYVSELDTSGNWNSLFSSTVSYDTTSGNLFLPVQSAYGVEVYIYNDTITLPGDGYYSISYEECCRNGAIINMSNPLSESMRLTTYFTSDSLNPNSSASYLSPPVAYLPADTLWSYNPLPFDPDGDSLVWSLVTPLGLTSMVNGYEYLSDSIYSNPSGIFTLDSVTGSLSWSASLVGNFEASFLIEEYRNGAKIGEMRRDMQFIVVPDTLNSMPQVSNMQSVPTNSGGYPYVKINPGQNYQLHLIANDADVNDVLDMEAYGAPFNFSVSPASHSVSLTGNGNEIEGVFSWTPDITHLSPIPYIVVFRTTDFFFYYDETIQFEVTSEVLSLTNIEGIEISNIYPNPANNKLFIPISLDRSDNVSIEIYNMIGVKISENNMNLGTGNHMIMKDIDLNSGQYIVVIRDKNGTAINTQQLVIVK